MLCRILKVAFGLSRNICENETKNNTKHWTANQQHVSARSRTNGYKAAEG